MDEKSRAKIKDIKSRIIAMLKERRSLERQDETLVSPSNYWSDFCSYFDYLLDLSEESFEKIRLHTYHLTGDNYQAYYFGDAETFMKTNGLNRFTKDLPSAYVLNEPEGGIGFRLGNGRFVSLDILRYQRAVSTLYRHGILSELAGNNRPRRLVLEIGAGYGGLAHHLSNICQNITYIIVDLPETLLFAATYLALHNPEKKIYVYGPDDHVKAIQQGEIESYDFVFIPNYKLESLLHLRYDLVLNLASFQEMRTAQVEANLEFIRKTCVGVLYSFNRDHQPRNKELSSLSGLLSQKFELIEIHEEESTRARKIINILKSAIRETRRLIAKFFGLLKRTTTGGRSAKSISALPYREYLCRPHNRSVDATN